ncbi:hypothetical protein [Bacillus sp. TH25]|uniref:hypothetical protein n=1 Tax=Bacillus sp. TH25 TaxID=2796391 RepID=UPI0019133B8C|nr:hypothetical protein [Bacillus sp. TH25]MBK5432010.1 hypothetical protein [Bacillus sp. TH25]
MNVPALKINNILEDWAAIIPPIENFTVENVLNAAHLNQTYYEEVFKYLMRLEGFMLHPVQIILCPYNHKCHVLDFNQPIDYEEVYECWCSDEEFDPDNVLIAFQFVDAYREECKKKKRIIQKSMLQLA